MFKILQARLQQYVNCELPDGQAGFRKDRGTELKLPTSTGSLKKWESSRKTFISALLTMPKPLTVWITTNCGEFLKRWEYQTTLPVFWETCLQVKKKPSKADMEQLTGSKLGKEYDKAIYCHPVYLTYMQNTSCEMLSWMNHKLESRLLGEIPITSYMQQRNQWHLAPLLLSEKSYGQRSLVGCSPWGL